MLLASPSAYAADTAALEQEGIADGTLLSDTAVEALESEEDDSVTGTDDMDLSDELEPALPPSAEGNFATLSEAEEAGVVAVSDDPEAYVDGEVIVVLAGESSESHELAVVEESVANLSVEDESAELEVLSSEPDGGSTVLVELPTDVSVADALLQLANDESVAFAQPNFRYGILDDELPGEEQASSSLDPFALEPLYAINDPATADPGQWWLGAVNAYTAWDKTRVAGTVTVAVIDTGVRLTHQDLANNIRKDLAYNAVTNAPLTTALGKSGDVSGHGTHVAGIIAAEANNGKNGAGVSYNAKILPIAMSTSSDGSSSTSIVIKALSYIIAHKSEANIRVINMSFGGYESADKDVTFYNKIKEAESKGILCVASAGNLGTEDPKKPDKNNDKVPDFDAKGDNTPCYPSDYPEVVSVTNVNSSLVWNGSDHNANKNIAAPGTMIYSTTYGSNTEMGYSSGTSMAAPVVSGIAALLFAKDPSLTPAQVRELLYTTAIDKGIESWDKGNAGWDAYYGWGVVNAKAALDATDQEHTITFDANSGTVSPASVTLAYNSALGTLPTPTRADYIFTGWYTAKVGGAKVTAGTKVTATVTYYAQWTVDFAYAAVTLSTPLAPSRVFDVAGGSITNGARIQLYNSNATAAQRFCFEKVINTNYYLIKNVKSGKVLDVANGKAFNGAVIQQYVSNGTAAQRWKLVETGKNTYAIASALNENMVLDLPNAASASGTKLQLYISNGTAAQRFVVNALSAPLKDGTYTVVSALASNKVLDVAGGSTANGANIQLYQANGTAAQSFKLSYDVTTGYCILTNTKSNKVLDVAGASTASGANVWSYQSNNTLAQRWTIAAGKTAGTYALYSALNGLALDVAGGKTANGTNVQMYAVNGTPAQVWTFKEVR
jgi:uncharacterized repeat protein (TIGR02543 family)